MNSRALAGCLALFAFAGINMGCIEAQLHHNAMQLTSDVAQLQKDQVLDNLGMFLEATGHDTMPAMVAIRSGGIQVADSVQPAFKIPYSHPPFTREADIQAQRQWTENWSIAPVTDPTDLARLRVLFKAAAERSKAKADPANIISTYQPQLRGIAGALSADPERAINLDKINFDFWSETPVKPGNDYGVHHGRHLWIKDEAAFATFIENVFKAMSNTQSGSGGGGGGHGSNQGFTPFLSPQTTS